MIRGYLSFDARHRWSFEQRQKNGKVVTFSLLDDLPFTWQDRVNEGTLVPGWQSSSSFLGHAFHVSAATCRHSTPGTLRKALAGDYADRPIWLDSYSEEYDALRLENVFDILTHAEYEALHNKGGKPIPTMCVLTIKKDAFGVPDCAKICIVVLGNLETTAWTKGDCFAPVVAQSAVRLLASMAVENKCQLKQADAKNAFCQPTLPPEEVVIVRPPHGCPISQPNTYWRLRKTLYGLRRSPRHWYELLKQVFANMDLFPFPHSPCVFMGVPIPGHPPIYIACYVDNM